VKQLYYYLKYHSNTSKCKKYKPHVPEHCLKFSNEKEAVKFAKKISRKFNINSYLYFDKKYLRVIYEK
jgi:hypothetical protein